MNRIFLVLLLLFSSFVTAQNIQKEIDSLVNIEAERLKNESKYKKLVILSQKIVEASRKANYIKGEAWGYLQFASAYCSLEDYSKSLSYIKKAKELAISIDDYSLQASISIETGRNYNQSGLSINQSIKHFEKAVGFAKKIDNEKLHKFYLKYAYQSLLSAYTNIERNDMALKYAWKARNIEEDAYTLAFLTFYHIEESGNQDSILYYLKSSTAFLAKHPNHIFEKAIVYNQWGKFYEREKQYKEAIDNFKKAETYAKESRLFDELLIAYDGLSRCYESQKNFQQAMIYERKFSQLQDSIIVVRNSNLNSIISHIVKDKERNFMYRMFHFYWLWILFFLLLVVITILWIRMRKYKKQRKKIETLQNHKDIIINKAQEENQELRLKVNESFDEVIQLAKDNSPEFLTRFTEVYPQVISKLLELDPKLRVTELALLAYVFLGFTTKDIARFTYKSTNTVRNRKFNLRKKLDIPGDDDMQIWLKNKINGC